MLKYNTQQIVEKFKNTHKDKYDYSKFEYKGYNIKSQILCIDHGFFEMSPKEHIGGKGCKKCGYINISKKLNKGVSYYIDLCKKAHNDKYNYDLVVERYSTIHNKYDIICPIHGIFNQSLSAHLHQKAGCPMCYKEKRHGFNLNKWASNSIDHVVTLYFIRIFNNDESFLKIGITYDSIEKRFCRLHLSGYNFEILSKISIKEKGGRAIALIETELHFSLQPYKYKPKNEFKGQGECYDITYLDIILKRIQYEIDLMRYNLMAFENLKDDCYDISGKFSNYINTRSENYTRYNKINP